MLPNFMWCIRSRTRFWLSSSQLLQNAVGSPQTQSSHSDLLYQVKMQYTMGFHKELMRNKHFQRKKLDFEAYWGWTWGWKWRKWYSQMTDILQCKTSSSRVFGAGFNFESAPLLWIMTDHYGVPICLPLTHSSKEARCYSVAKLQNIDIFFWQIINFEVFSQIHVGF